MSIRTAVEKSLLLCAGILVGTILSVGVGAQSSKMYFFQAGRGATVGLAVDQYVAVICSTGATAGRPVATSTFPPNANVGGQLSPSTLYVYCYAN
jgi:hypothetical protein